jgi:hypothetical protein
MTATAEIPVLNADRRPGSQDRGAARLGREAAMNRATASGTRVWREATLRVSVCRDRLLGRLLSASGHDIGCEQCFELLDVYVDAKLAGEDAECRVPGMRTHLEGCPACAEEHASLRELLMVLK